MQKNQAARQSLKEYLGMRAPGYALLIDAPWGAGKTYFVKSVCREEPFSGQHRYCSLNGVSDVQGFRRALINSGAEAMLAARVNKAASLLGELVKMENLGTFARDLIEERLLEGLPDILIFDDLERSTIPSQELLGLLNGFVEHQGKLVIMLAHSEADPQKDAFLKGKEKLIGRTLKIDPEIKSALPSFFESLPDGKGRKFLIENTDRVELTFKQAGHGNLRLLRNAVRDCALLLDRVEDHLFQAKEALVRFAGTHLAFSMSLAKGEISEQQLLERGDYKKVLGRGEAEAHPLKSLYERFEGLDIFADSNVVMTHRLAESIFVNGFVDTGSLNDLLNSTGQFIPQEPNPLWKRVLHWHELEWTDIRALSIEAEEYLFSEGTILPGPYLQTAFGLLLIAQYEGSDGKREQLVGRLL